MLIVRWCQNYFTQYDCFCRNKITCCFFYLRIFRFHIFCCVHDFGLPYCDFFFFTVLHLSTFTFSLWSFIAAFFVNCFQWCCCLIECGCSCECVCVCVMLQKCIQCLRFKNITAIPVIHLCKTCTCVCTKTSKICKIHIPLTSGR